MRIVVHHVAGKTFRVSRQVEVAGSNILGLETIGTVEYSPRLIPGFEFKPENDGVLLKAREEEYVAGVVDGVNVAYTTIEGVIEKLEKMKEVLAA